MNNSYQRPWPLERPVNCESCIGQGHSGNTPKIFLEEMSPGNAPKGYVKCEWCGIAITAPTLPEAIHKWRCFQEIIRLGYSCLNDKKSIEKEALEKSPEQIKWEGYIEYLKIWISHHDRIIHVAGSDSPLSFEDWCISIKGIEQAIMDKKEETKAEDGWLPPNGPEGGAGGYLHEVNGPDSNFIL